MEDFERAAIDGLLALTPASTQFDSGKDFVNKMLIVYAQNNDRFLEIARKYQARKFKIGSLRRKPMSKLQRYTRKLKAEHKLRDRMNTSMDSTPLKKPRIRASKQQISMATSRIQSSRGFSLLSREAERNQERQKTHQSGQHVSPKKRQASALSVRNSFMPLIPRKHPAESWMSTFDRVEKASHHAAEQSQVSLQDTSSLPPQLKISLNQTTLTAKLDRTSLHSKDMLSRVHQQNSLLSMAKRTSLPNLMTSEERELAKCSFKPKINNSA